ncbi:MAG TPA: DUF2189 domain-containing protein [Polymorphobacter sp.]|nr:DUF2189 domain-containing protein [Polymorphobacter sp.]
MARQSTLFGAAQDARPATETAALPVNRIKLSDLSAALRAGLADFNAMPTHLVLLMLIYPIMGLMLARWAMGNAMLPLLFPLVSGFALIGPVAAVGLYELSRRRETGAETHIQDAFAVRASPALGTIILLGAMLLVLFGGWLWSASLLYTALFDIAEPASFRGFISDIIYTPAGWKLIVYGNLLGFGFALVTLMVSAISFPLALDRNVSFGTAVATSVAAFRENPLPMLAWGLIVATLLLLGALPLLVGLALVMPVLGHATWHLYRRVVPD